MSRFSGDGSVRLFGDVMSDGDSIVCAYLDGIVLLSDFSHTARSTPAATGVFTFRVIGSSFGFRALGELHI